MKNEKSQPDFNPNKARDMSPEEAAKIFAAAVTRHIEAVITAQNRGNKATLIQMAEKNFVDILIATAN